MIRRTPLLRRAAAAALIGAVLANLPTLSAATAAEADPTSPRSAAAASPLADNAALRYWPAFHFLNPTSAEQDKVFDEMRTSGPNDPAATKVLNDHATSLRYLHSAAMMPRAEWNLDYEQGFGLLLPHAQAARNLSRVACLRAHRRALTGDTVGAADDLADAMTLGRHLAADPILVVLLVHYAIDQNAIDTAGDHLIRMKGPGLDRLAERLEKLPATPSTRDSIRIERDFGQRWAAKEVRSWAGKPDLADRLKTMFVGGGGPETAGASDALDRALKNGGGTAEGVAAQIDALGQVYDDLAAALDLPYAQARQRIGEIRDKADKDNPFAGLLLPAYGRVLEVEARATMRMTMLKAAIAIVRGGEEKLKDFKDPFGDGPFEYEAAQGGGFELRSKLVVKDEPVTLRVGMPVAPKKL